MRLMPSQFTIAEINDMLERQDLVVNKEYQRSPRIWPAEAKSYFIDTILEGYPFPKIYFYETYDRKRKRPRREIVDGQQRVTTFVDFYMGQFRLTSASQRFRGSVFGDLTEEQQKTFIMTPVQVDIILSAERPEILEMFRRMNAYTVPLNPAEKRHGEFQGKFKWFIVELADAVSPVLEQFEIFSSKQILRMADAEFITDLAIALDLGIVNREAREFQKIYRRYDNDFAASSAFLKHIRDFFKVLADNFSELQGTFLMKPYVVYALFCAMTQRKYGIPSGEDTVGVPTVGNYFTDRTRTIESLRELTAAHEMGDLSGPYADYVRACASGTHRKALRQTRARYLARALR